MIDLTIMKRQVLSGVLGRNGLRRADVDADGSVSVVDLVALQKYVLTGQHMPAYERRAGFSYAIDQRIERGVQEDTNKGFREKAYVNLDNEIGSALEWTVFVPEDGEYLCTFCTANGSDVNRSMEITVNGGSERYVQDFPATGGWTVWEEQSIVLPLHRGKNTVRMTSLADQGGPNFDYLRTERTAGAQ